MRRFEADVSGPPSESIGGSGLSFAGLTEFVGRTTATGPGDLSPGTRLGDITIVRLIDEGGMGRVYEGLQGMPCRTVAVKVIRQGVLSASAAKRFEHEAQIMGRLTHPGIARLYSVGIQQLSGCEVPYFVMEYIDDALSITAFASQRSLSTRDRVRLFSAACGAVAHGHQKGVIHRDLKPGNILVDAAGLPKIIDFGVARSTDADVALTTMHTDVGQLVGTLAYMSPEQFDGAADDIDVRADVYALGVVLYELLTGGMPYDVMKRPVYDVARIVRDVEPRSVSTVNPRLRGDLNTIVATCLEKDRSRRYSSAAELEADLGRYLRGEPIAASPPSLVDAVLRLARRHRLAAVAAAGILTALVLAVAGISIFAFRAERQRVLADTARQEAIREGQAAAAGREAADRERARADSESKLARQRLYVANLLAIRSCLDTNNLQMARRLFDDNAAIVGQPLPLEMHCMAAELDDALAVLDCQLGPIQTIEYSPDGTILAIRALTDTTARQGSGSLLIAKKIRMKDSLYGIENPSHRSVEFFHVRSGHRFERLGAESPGSSSGLDKPWIQLWRARYGATERVAYEPNDSVEPLAISPDGRRVAVHAADGGVRIVDQATHEDEVLLDGQRGRLTSVAFNANGTRLITKVGYRPPQLWDTDTGRLIARCGDEGRTSETFVFSPDGGRLATVCKKSPALRDVIVYDTGEGHRLCTITLTPRQSITDSAITGLAADESIVMFTPDGLRLITSSHEGDLAVWNVADGMSLGRLQGHAAVVSAVAVSPDGSTIVSGAANGHVRVWNAESFALERELIGHAGAVVSLAFHPDGVTLASGSLDGSVRIWSGTVVEPLAVLPGIGEMTAAVFSPNGQQLALAPKKSGGVELWDPRTVQRHCTLEGTGTSVSEIAYSPDGSLVAAAFESPNGQGEVRVWHTDSAKLLWRLGEHIHGAVSVAFSADGSRILTTSGDRMAMVWDVGTGKRVMAHSVGARSNLAKTAAVFGLGGRRVASNSPVLLDSDTGSVVAELAPQGQVTCLAVSPDGRLLATGVAMGSVNLTDFSDGSRLAILDRHRSLVRALAFNADGSQLLIGSQDGTARLFDIRRDDGHAGTEIQLLHGHEGSVESVAFSANGRRLITGSSDGTVRIWDADGGHELLKLPGQRNDPGVVALSPDGATLVTATSGGLARIWGLSDAEIVCARQTALAIEEGAPSSVGGANGGGPDLGEFRRPHGLPGLLEATEKRGEVGEILPIQAERFEMR
jgi:WD40 repeat protein/tRNA A-37 threonylcarbamoyl transferase component Bud32